MWPTFMYTWRCSAGGVTVILETIVSFLAQLIVKHKSRNIQLLFTAFLPCPCVRHLPICDRLHPDFFMCYILLLLGIGFHNGPTLKN